MKYIISKMRTGLLLAVSAILVLSSCNKDVPQFNVPAGPANGTSPTLANILDSSYYSILKAGMTRAGLLTTLGNNTLRFTLFAPDDAAFAASGIPNVATINALPIATVGALMNYAIAPQTLPSSSFGSSFPNFPYPSLLNPAPTLSSLLRFDLYTSRTNALYVNNVPIKAADIPTVNGLIQKVPVIVAPPQRALWERINTDGDLTILKAAIVRADSGVAPTSSSSLIGALNNIGANLTVFAPSNAAFKNLISALTGGLIPVGAPDSTFTVFLRTSNSITTQLVQGIVVYHILGSRAFTNNLPTTAIAVPTLLNGAIPTHPGVSVKCTFAGTVTGATVKGLVNATASNIAFNPTPDTNASYGATAPSPFTYVGTCDQFYTNGVLHKIDQVLLPQ